ncbi:RluA family pseudouridine synthase [Helicobacter acinonychis]|uniref:RNA pseudouridylate synthase n=1 Tax=Helicobacter acinonychis (strain Sheeba) TaxID=382638 RepID=Q17X79_HELAH|nr:RluA family pseudouridine synthase [Helicobacter acinonychis]CAJ99747.1 putative ribosomal pseudouridine synthase [Helicobacter acinonychis str. Sheeba]STP04304.1 ribosomal pseudouridine synthase [Helicobacter acinonychis]
MPFVEEEFEILKPTKALFLVCDILKCSLKEAQRHLDKQRLKQNQQIVRKSQIIQGIVSLIYFKPNEKQGKLVFETKDFGIFDKPTQVYTHPKGYFYHESLLDCIQSHFGKNAHPAHRLDYETSGLVLVGKTPQSTKDLKALFMQKKVKKTYLALVHGLMDQNTTIDKPILTPENIQKDLRIRSKISPLGKPSTTLVEPLAYNSFLDVSLLKITPLTGRTHQIRLHLSSMNHRIVGEGLYGVADENAREYLQLKRENNAPLLMLHALSLEFEFKGAHYKITSPMPKRFMPFLKD